MRYIRGADETGRPLRRPKSGVLFKSRRLMGAAKRRRGHSLVPCGKAAVGLGLTT